MMISDDLKIILNVCVHSLFHSSLRPSGWKTLIQSICNKSTLPLNTIWHHFSFYNSLNHLYWTLSNPYRVSHTFICVSPPRAHGWNDVILSLTSSLFYTQLTIGIAGEIKSTRLSICGKPCYKMTTSQQDRCRTSSYGISKIHLGDEHAASSKIPCFSLEVVHMNPRCTSLRAYWRSIMSRCQVWFWSVFMLSRSLLPSSVFCSLWFIDLLSWSTPHLVLISSSLPVQELQSPTQSWPDCLICQSGSKSGTVSNVFFSVSWEASLNLDSCLFSFFETHLQGKTYTLLLLSHDSSFSHFHNL